MARRFLLFILCAVSLGGCGSMGSGIQLQSLASTTAASTTPETSTTAEGGSGSNLTAKKPAKQPGVNTQSKPRQTVAKTMDAPTAMAATTPNYGSPQWEKEQRESERQERRIKEAIQGICRGC